MPVPLLFSESPTMKQRGLHTVNPTIIFALLAAVISGVAIGAQGTLGSRAGAVIGPVPNGILMHLAGAAGGLVLLLGFVLAGRGPASWSLTRGVWWMVTAAGLLGLVIVSGVAYSWARIGVTAGIATVFMGQMLVGVVVDALGIGASSAVPVDLRRVVGLLVMALATYLLLPRG